MKLTHDAAPVIKAAYKRPYTQTTKQKSPSHPYTQFPIINQLNWEFQSLESAHPMLKSSNHISNFLNANKVKPNKRE